jgi:hypothetical protein
MSMPLIATGAPESALGHPGGETSATNILDYGALPNTDELQTPAIQRAIDAATSKSAPGVVRIPAGSYRIANLKLRSNLHLFLEEGAVLLGSTDHLDYGQESWTSAMIQAIGTTNIRISGQGIIDGQNSVRPGGEEGFRGHHIFFFHQCENIRIESITLQHSGNYAFLGRKNQSLHFQDVTLLGGHDGLHIQNCEEVTVRGCDFRTGDDCLAGTDNQHVTVTKCRFNSACNAFRLGVDHLTVRHCVFQGPGEFPHKVSVMRGQARHSMGAAFIHFSPLDRQPTIPSDHWLIEDCVFDQIESFYTYDHENGLWQTGQPARCIHFARIQATRVRNPIRIIGDADRQLALFLENVSIALDPAHANQPVLEARRFGAIRLKEVNLSNDGTHPLIVVREGNLLTSEGTPPELSAEQCWNVAGVAVVERQR